MGTVVCHLLPWTAIMFKLVCLLGVVGFAYAGHPVCKTVWEEKCWNEPREQCNIVQKPYTVTDYKEECNTKYEDECRQVNGEQCEQIEDEVCESSENTKV